MADPRNPGGDDPRRRGESDAGNLLRDLRSLRDSGSGRDQMLRPAPQQTPQPEQPRGAGARGILAVLLVVIVIVGVAAYGSGLLSDGHAVVMPPSGGSTPPTAAPPTVASATPGAGAPDVPVTPPRHVDLARDEIPAGLEPAKVGVYYALARFLLERFDPAVQPQLRWQQPAVPSALGATAGPATWYGQLAKDLPDELSVVVSATTSACVLPDAKRRELVGRALVRVINAPATSLQEGLSALVQGDDARAVALLKASKPADGDQRLALALARCLAGEDVAAVDRELGTGGADGGWIPALRAHLALIQNRRDDALQLLNQANGAAQGPAELYLAAGLAMRLGQLPLANGLLERVKVTAPGDVHALFLRGLIAEVGGRGEEAKGLYGQALRGCQDPRLAVVARTQRALMLQKAGAAEQAHRDVKAVEDIDPKWPGLLLAQARAALRTAQDAVGPSRNESLAQARGLWEEMIVQQGATDEILSSLLRCYTEARDQGSARHGIAFLQMLLDHRFVTQTPQRTEVASVVAMLQDRIRPRPIYEEAPR